MGIKQIVYATKQIDYLANCANCSGLTDLSMRSKRKLREAVILDMTKYYKKNTFTCKVKNQISPLESTNVHPYDAVIHFRFMYS